VVLGWLAFAFVSVERSARVRSAFLLLSALLLLLPASTVTVVERHHWVVSKH
jgi:hypothetical protein